MVEFFGVRHHSPTAARLLRQRLLDAPPKALLVEGPTEFNPHLSELTLDHRLPVMIYSWAPLFPDAPEASPQAAIRRSSFYPLTDFSPEWVALRTARELTVHTEFIDLPWLAFVDIATAENRFAEPVVTERITEHLQREFGVDDLSTLFDELIEVDPRLDLATHRTRMRLIGELLRGDADEETRRREAHMAGRILDARDRHGDDLLVVCGAAHVAGLEQLLASPPEPVEVWQPPADDDRYGIALTPTSYAALDALDGYDAGQPSPGFYDRLFRDRDAGRPDTAEALLAEVVTTLRGNGQFLSPADLMAVRVTAGALARLRGHPQIWRTDLLEGIVSALVKDDRGQDHPLLAAVLLVLRGDRMGGLAAGTRQPPLTLELRTRLSALGLMPTPTLRQEVADLATDEGVERSRLLHGVAVLEIPGFTLLQGAQHDGMERWQLIWTPTFEGGLVEAARFGGSIEQAVVQRLLVQAADIVDDPAAAARLVMQAALCGVGQLSTSLQARTENLLARAVALPGLGEAIGVLMQLYRYDPILRATGRADLGRLLGTAFDRAVRLLERLTPLAEGPALEGFSQAMRALTDCAERVGDQLGLDLVSFHHALDAVVLDDRQAPSVRGACLGAQWLAEARGEEEIAERISVLAVPEHFGDFVAGLLGVVREAALRRPAALLHLDQVLTSLSEEGFLDSLPGLRRAFSGYTPAERAKVADLVLGEDAVLATIRFSGSVEDAVGIASFETELAVSLRRFLGVGGAHG
ncbi:MAG: DUF5682 family protein [Arachnia propionica]|uniref:DUF5682 family protein n=1 Tax=Arachnia propionica TaxID=1750 RepID=UPI0026FBEF24|nr:DUF5682 family protein [Arachnia propionica]